MFRAFLKLGCTLFGGPIAHLGYFRTEFVQRRGWIGEAGYAELVGMCQFLPGPASSQVGFALGLMRAGWLGGLAAWTGFTLPSAILLAPFALGAARLAIPGVAHGLGLVAVAAVAQAVWGMARSLCPDRATATIAAAACVFALLAPAAWGQIVAIALSCVAGLVVCRGERQEAADVLAVGIQTWAAIGCLGAFGGLLALSVAFPHGIAAAFYRSGALVFGGGHVVLPLLHGAVVTPGWVSEGAFVAGYGATQAVPGPLFTFAAYLGAAIAGLGGAILALIAIFLPGLLLVAGALPFWSRLRRAQGRSPRCAASTRGWSVCWGRRCMTRSGPGRCAARPISRLPWAGSCC